MPRKTYSLEAAAELPSSLPLGPEFLGLLRPATIGGVSVHVVLPDFTFSADDRFSPRIHSRCKVDWVDYYSQAPYEDWPPFGQVMSWNPQKPNGGISLFYATRLVVLSRNKVTESEAQQLLHQIDSWLELLDLWTEVIATVDLQSGGIEVEQHGAATKVWLDKGRKSVQCKHPIAVIGTHPDPLEITPLHWRKILAKASSGDLPPEPYIFLKDARRALNEKRYRRSVLDSATATEVALTKLRDDALAAMPHRLASYVQEKAQQIGGLIGFHSRNGQSLPARIQQEIAEPRNKGYT